MLQNRLSRPLAFLILAQTISFNAHALLKEMPLISLSENETEKVEQVETTKLAGALASWAGMDEENFSLSEKELALGPSSLKLRRVRINLNFSVKVGLGPIFGVEFLTRQVVIWSKK